MRSAATTKARISSGMLLERALHGFGRRPYRDDRDDRHADDVDRNGVGAVLREEGRRDERREAPGDGRRELRAQRGAAVTDARAEELGKKRALWRVHRGVRAKKHEQQR